MVTAGGGNVDDGTFGVRYGGNTKGVNYRFYGKGFTNGPEFHSNGNNFDEWRMGQIGFRTDWTSKRHDTFTFQGDLYDEKAGEISQVGELLATFPAHALSGGGSFPVEISWGVGSGHSVGDRTFKCKPTTTIPITSSPNSARLATPLTWISYTT